MPAAPPTELVLQSAPPSRAGWVDRCLTSVAAWARSRGMEYRLIGDELFDRVPSDWRAAIGPEKLPVTDYARLLWIEHLLGQGYERVIWMDADILFLDMDFVPPPGDFFCREMWVFRRPDHHIGRLDALNNCAMGFAAGSGLLAWYLDACAKAPGPKPLHKLGLGPNLLKVRHRSSPMPCTDAIPTFSPLMIRAVMRGDLDLLKTYQREWAAPIAAVHLCSSLSNGQEGTDAAAKQILDATLDKLQAGIMNI